MCDHYIGTRDLESFLWCTNHILLTLNFTTDDEKKTEGSKSIEIEKQEAKEKTTLIDEELSRANTSEVKESKISEEIIEEVKEPEKDSKKYEANTSRQVKVSKQFFEPLSIFFGILS